MSDDFIVEADKHWRSIKSASRNLGDGVTYGPPVEHFARTIGMINALFAHKLKEPLTVSDWPQIMMCDKMARHQEKPIEDNSVDCAGYSACWYECLSHDSQPRP